MIKNITKADIVDTISKKTGITKLDTKEVLEGVLDTIINEIAKGNKIEIRGFGVFHSKRRKARLARNPKTGDLVPLKERFVPLFKSSVEFTRKVNVMRFSEKPINVENDSENDLENYLNNEEPKTENNEPKIETTTFTFWQ
jgi:DNA-binding protein HU-beta